MFRLSWEEWAVGAIGVWLIATPCLLGLRASEGLWTLGFTANILLAVGALMILGVRAVLRDQDLTSQTAAQE